MKPWFKSVFRWFFLIDALVAVAFSVLTVVMTPIWIHWSVGIVVPEIGLWLALLTDARLPHALVLASLPAHAFDLVSFNSPSGQITTYSVTWFQAAVTQ